VVRLTGDHKNELAARRWRSGADDLGLLGWDAMTAPSIAVATPFVGRMKRAGSVTKQAGHRLDMI
jgi:hypothetical protein